MTEVAKIGNKWLHNIAKNGNKQNDLQLYRELKSLFCHFWQYFAFSSVIMLSKNCQKWQFLLTSKLPKMANEHSSNEVLIWVEPTQFRTSMLSFSMLIGYVPSCAKRLPVKQRHRVAKIFLNNFFFAFIRLFCHRL